MPRILPDLKPNLGLLLTGFVILLFPVIVPNPYYLNVANIIGLNTIIVVGLNLLIGYAGQISLGHAAFYGLGAYISGILTVTYNVPPWLAMIAALAVTGLLALLIGIPTLKLQGHYLVMATLGFNLIVNIIIVQWDKVTGGPSGFPGIPSLSIAGWPLDTDKKMYYLIWAFVLGSIVLSLNLVKSRVGRGLRAVHGSEIAAGSLGVRTDMYKVKVFVLSALYASLAGSLYAHYLTFISPKTFDIFFSVELVTMVIVGGMGNVWGALFGAVFLTSLPNVLHFFDEYKDIFYGLILVIILIFLPQGIVVAATNRSSVWLGKPRETDRLERRHETDRQTEGLPVISFPQSSVAEARANGEPILSVKDVCVNFGGIAALAEVSFDLPRGKVTALIGPNGAGKTTMINVISGVQVQDQGEISFAGRDVKGRRPYVMAAMGLTRTFQNNQVFENMTVLENVMVGLHSTTRNEFLTSLFHLPRFKQEEMEIERRSWEVLKFFDLDTQAHRLAASLSFGEQKRIEMARALASHPTLMLLDEPVAGLNMTETAEIAQLIEKIRCQGITVLLVEHDMNLVMGISDKIVVLDYGRKIAEGRPKDIQKNGHVVAAYLGSAN